MALYDAISRSVNVVTAAAIAITALAFQHPAAADELPESLELRVMTFNVRYASPPGQPNSWDLRRSVLMNCIRQQDPDLIGTQETLFIQVKDMEHDLPQYAWVGLGRAGGSRGEFMAIFYKRERFEVMAYDHFWLSDTPEVIASRTWGHDNHRMVTWARFKERQSGREFYLWNTHFDHRVQEAREKSADLLLDRINQITPQRPVVVTGDFNAQPDNVVYAALAGEQEGGISLFDAWTAADTIDGDLVGTFHGFRGETQDNRRIDWILVSPEFDSKRCEVIGYHEDGQYPSDHYPVVCDLILNPPAPMPESTPTGAPAQAPQ